MIVLTRSDASLNMNRFYALHLQGDLFGGVALVREWGRIGHPGTVRAALFPSGDEAHAELARTLERRGPAAPPTRDACSKGESMSVGRSIQAAISRAKQHEAAMSTWKLRVHFATQWGEVVSHGLHHCRQRAGQFHRRVRRSKASRSWCPGRSSMSAPVS